MKKVTKEQLWEFVKDKDVVYSCAGEYPYTGYWKTKSGELVGKIVPKESCYINEESNTKKQ